MRMTRLGIKTNYNRGTEEALSQEILMQSSQLKRHSAGIYGLGPLILKARNNVVDIIRETLEKYNCVEVSLPTLQPKQIWDESGRWAEYVDSNQMFHFTGRNGEYCLAPTGEEIVLDFVNKNIESYKDLPFNVFQIGMKYRDEVRVRGGLLRSKEFLMKDGYSFHSNQQSLENEYENMKKAYLEIFSKLGLEVKPVKAISAEMGGKISEEFMLPSPIGEDKMLFDEKTGLALNIEILDDKELLEQYLEEYEGIDINDFEVIQCIELGHIFQLGTRYSEKMNGYFTDSDGKRKPYLMGCYGIGINRLLGAICEQTCDEDGLQWPMDISPYECSIIPVKGFDSKAEEVYKKLSAEGYKILFDDREIGFGPKIKDSKLLGIPYLVIIGRNFENDRTVELESRETGEKVLIKLDELIEESVNWKKI